VSEMHPEKADAEMVVMEAGRSRELEVRVDLSCVQFLKADSPIDLMVLGISMDVSLVQSSK
jgi:hypothetical protein